MEKLKDIHKNVNFEENNIFIAYERFWMLMNVFEHFWTFMNVHERLWMFMNVYEC